VLRLSEEVEASEKNQKLYMQELMHTIWAWLVIISGVTFLGLMGVSLAVKNIRFVILGFSILVLTVFLFFVGTYDIRQRYKKQNNKEKKRDKRNEHSWIYKYRIGGPFS